MALISCPECRNQVSEVAFTCPKCGAPIATRGTETPAITIQRTGKRLKLQQLLAGIFFSIGLIAFIFNATYASYSNVGMSIGVIVFFFIGLIWYVAVKFRIWWHHE